MGNLNQQSFWVEQISLSFQYLILQKRNSQIYLIKPISAFFESHLLELADALDTAPQNLNILLSLSDLLFLPFLLLQIFSGL